MKTQQQEQEPNDPAANVKKTAIRLTAACRANMCVCYMKLMKWESAVEQASKAITYVEKGSQMQVPKCLNISPKLLLQTQWSLASTLVASS